MGKQVEVDTEIARASGISTNRRRKLKRRKQEANALRLTGQMIVVPQLAACRPQHSKWNCVGTNKPQHMHMYRSNKFSATTIIEFESAN